MRKYLFFFCLLFFTIDSYAGCYDLGGSADSKPLPRFNLERYELPKVRCTNGTILTLTDFRILDAWQERFDFHFPSSSITRTDFQAALNYLGIDKEITWVEYRNTRDFLEKVYKHIKPFDDRGYLESFYEVLDFLYNLQKEKKFSSSSDSRSNEDILIIQGKPNWWSANAEENRPNIDTEFDDSDLDEGDEKRPISYKKEIGLESNYNEDDRTGTSRETIYSLLKKVLRKYRSLEKGKLDKIKRTRGVIFNWMQFKTETDRLNYLFYMMDIISGSNSQAEVLKILDFPTEQLPLLAQAARQGKWDHFCCPWEKDKIDWIKLSRKEQRLYQSNLEVILPLLSTRYQCIDLLRFDQFKIDVLAHYARQKRRAFWRIVSFEMLERWEMPIDQFAKLCHSIAEGKNDYVCYIKSYHCKMKPGTADLLQLYSGRGFNYEKFPGFCRFSFYGYLHLPLMIDSIMSWAQWQVDKNLQPISMTSLYVHTRKSEENYKAIFSYAKRIAEIQRSTSRHKEESSDTTPIDINYISVISDVLSKAIRDSHFSEVDLIKRYNSGVGINQEFDTAVRTFLTDFYPYEHRKYYRTYERYQENPYIFFALEMGRWGDKKTSDPNPMRDLFKKLEINPFVFFEGSDQSFVHHQTLFNRFEDFIPATNPRLMLLTLEHFYDLSIEHIQNIFKYEKDLGLQTQEKNSLGNIVYPLLLYKKLGQYTAESVPSIARRLREKNKKGKKPYNVALIKKVFGEVDADIQRRKNKREYYVLLDIYHPTDPVACPNNKC